MKRIDTFCEIIGQRTLYERFALRAELLPQGMSGRSEQQSPGLEKSLLRQLRERKAALHSVHHEADWLDKFLYQAEAQGFGGVQLPVQGGEVQCATNTDCARKKPSESAVGRSPQIRIRKDKSRIRRGDRYIARQHQAKAGAGDGTVYQGKNRNGKAHHEFDDLVQAIDKCRRMVGSKSRAGG